jgi:hypothetical protein
VQKGREKSRPFDFNIKSLYDSHLLKALFLGRLQDSRYYFLAA